jgi:hypothetical protein
MQTYKELKELAVMCAYNSRTSTSTSVAVELWNMAEEYQRKAAQLGPLPNGKPLAVNGSRGFFEAWR